MEMVQKDQTVLTFGGWWNMFSLIHQTHHPFLHLENDLKTNTQSRRDTYGRMWSESWRAFAVFVYPCPDPCGNAPLLTCAKPGRLGQQINLGRWSRGMAESKLPFRGEKWSRKCPQPQTHLSIQGIGREVKHRWASTTSARAGFGFVLAALYSPNFNIYTGWKYMVLVRF